MHGKFFGASSLKQAKCAESFYAVGAQKAAKEIANARKLHYPAQLCASVLAHASKYIEIICHSQYCIAISIIVRMN